MSGGIIKAGDARAISGGLYSLDLRDIADRAEGMLAAARADAERILLDARRKADTERAAAKVQGFQEGRSEGLLEGRTVGETAALDEARKRFAADQASLLSSLGLLLSEFSRRREQLYVSSRRDVALLAIAIASRVAKKFAVLDEAAPELAADAYAEALALIREPTDVVIAVNPEDFSAVEKLAAPLHATLKDAGHVRMVPEAAVSRGGIRLSTADTRIDGSIQQRIDRIATELIADWRERMKALPIETE